MLGTVVLSPTPHPLLSTFNLSCIEHHLGPYLHFVFWMPRDTAATLRFANLHLRPSYPPLHLILPSFTPPRLSIPNPALFTCAAPNILYNAGYLTKYFTDTILDGPI